MLGPICFGERPCIALHRPGHEDEGQCRVLLLLWPAGQVYIAFIAVYLKTAGEHKHCASGCGRFTMKTKLPYFGVVCTQEPTHKQSVTYH